jgi:hypothetical protein
MDEVSIKINEGMMGGESEVLVDRPVITVIDCEVQHIVGQGDLDHHLGYVGICVIMQPNGNPRLAMDVRHADGTALIAIMNGPLSLELAEMLVNACDAASDAQQASIESTRQ